MRMIVSLLVALIISVAPEVRAQGAGDTRFDAAITSVKVGPEGDVTGLVFGDGSTLDQPQVEAGTLDQLKVSRVRPLPFKLLPVGDAGNPQMAVIADFTATMTLAIPSGAEATLGLTPEGEVDLARSGARLATSGENLLACPPGTCPVGSNCYPCLAPELYGELQKCPPGTCPVGGNCYPCLTTQLSQAKSYSLIEYVDEATGEPRLGVVSGGP